MIYILIHLNLLLDMLLQFSLLPVMSYLDTNKHSNIVEKINWVYQSSQLQTWTTRIFLAFLN